MRLSRLKWIVNFFLAAILCAPAWGATPALPGTLNYVEGQAVIGTETLNPKSVGTVDLEAGQSLSTQAGKVEVLLTPGVFFRLGSDSSATLVSPSLTNTEVALTHGQAMVEVAEIHKDNLLRITQNGATAQLLKTGVYGFDANSGNVQVFNGEALVQDGDRQVKVKGGHQFNVEQTASLKTAKFDKSAYQQTDLYRFSNLRSQYLAEANVDAAIAYGGGSGWYGSGWYWDPYFTAYTWIPGDGLFYSPFGWGFYSPLWVGYSPYYGRYYPRYAGGYARPFAARGGHAFAGGRSGFAGRPGVAARPATAFRGLSQSGASASHFGGMGGGFHGGGFHR